MASQSIKQGSNLRATVRDLTLKALQQRELTLDQIRKVLRSITEGVNLSVAKRETKVEKAFSDTVAGMDDALLKAVQASNVALHRLTGKGYDYEDSNLKQALDELEKLEDEFLQSIAKATESASEKIKAPWARVLKQTKLSGTATGTQAASTIRDYAKRARKIDQFATSVSYVDGPNNLSRIQHLTRILAPGSYLLQDDQMLSDFRDRRP